MVWSMAGRAEPCGVDTRTRTIVISEAAKSQGRQGPWQFQRG
jgi:hypothetical protein